MLHGGGAAEKAGAGEVLHEAAHSEWFEKLARVGYAAKGTVYIVVGALAVLAAFGAGGSLTDTRGALRAIAARPYGSALLGAVALGLVAYVVWRWVQAVADVDGKGRTLRGLGVRSAYFMSGTLYAGLAFTAARILLHVQADEARAGQYWSTRLMALPLGRWLLALGGMGVVLFGLYQIFKGYRAKFRRRLKLGELGEAHEGWAVLSGRVGYAARGVVFCLVGTFVIQAALHSNAAEVRGLDGALQSLLNRPAGPWLLVLVAAGLIAYGVFALVEARFRRIGRR